MELSTEPDSKKASFDKYLDELLYFFKETEYNVVVFQDLDRFNEVEIFSKLRELNHLVNTANQIENKVVFVYAVKDDMFNNLLHRTKFFDFIIPIIPYINPFNSYDKMSSLFSNTGVEKYFLHEVSLYIGDMRLLNNIFNEYLVYSKQIGMELNKDKLLAIVIYKNFYPKDFSDLHKNEGMVFNIIENVKTSQEDECRGNKDKTKAAINKSYPKFFDNKDNKLLGYLLLNGYIDEGYDHYISHTHEDIISSHDRKFLISVVEQDPLVFDYKLDNAEGVLKKINPAFFSEFNILNFDLICHLTSEKAEHREQYNKLMEQLTHDSSDPSEDYIKYHLKKRSSYDDFLRSLAQKDGSFWGRIYKDNSFSKDEKNHHFQQLLKNTPAKRIAELDCIDEFIRDMESLPKGNCAGDNLIEVMELLKIKLSGLKDVNNNQKTFVKIYQNGLYELNETLINTIVSQFDSNIDVNNELARAHLTTINSSDNLHPLKIKIESNLSEYIENVFLKIESNTEETEKTILDLLNNLDLNHKLIIQILEKEAARISNISTIGENIWKKAFYDNKVLPTWDNVLYYYQNVSSIDQSLTNYLNVEENAAELTKTRVGNSFCEQNNTFDKEIISKLLKDILLKNNLHNTSYQMLVKSNNYFYPQLDISNINEDKVDILIQEGKFKFNIDNYNSLKNLGKNIDLLESKANMGIKILDDVLLDSDDLLKILHSGIFSSGQKREALVKIDTSIIVGSEMATLIYDLTKRSNPSVAITSQLISELGNIDLKIKLINKLGVNNLNRERLLKLLETFSDAISKISLQNGKQTTIYDNKANSKFAGILEKLGVITSYKKDKDKKIKLFIKKI